MVSLIDLLNACTWSVALSGAITAGHGPRPFDGWRIFICALVGSLTGLVCAWLQWRVVRYAAKAGAGVTNAKARWIFFGAIVWLVVSGFLGFGICRLVIRG